MQLLYLCIISAVQNRYHRIRLHQGLLYINHTLVAASFPQELDILFIYLEFSIYQNIHILHNRIVKNVLPGIPCI